MPGRAITSRVHFPSWPFGPQDGHGAIDRRDVLAVVADHHFIGPELS